jgi:hypothetical protein
VLASRLPQECQGPNTAHPRIAEVLAQVPITLIFGFFFDSNTLFLVKLGESLNNSDFV